MSKSSEQRQNIGGYIQFKRDRCEECGATDICDRDENGFLIRRKKVLTVHHINNNHLDNRLENLQTLCRKCHYKKHYK